MKNRITLALSFVWMVLLCAGCQKDRDAMPKEQLVPLQVGNEWAYEVTDFDNEGKVLNKNRVYRAVYKDTLINRTRYFVFNDGMLARNTHEGYVHYNTAGGLDVILYQNASYGGISYGYQYPTYLMFVLTSRSAEQLPVVGSALDLAAFTFEIKREYRQSNSSTITSIQKDYVSPNIGLVRSDTYYGDSDVLMRRQELLSYRLR